MTRLRRLAVPIVIAVLAAYIVAGLVGGDPTPPSDADRVAAIASNLRCPFCGGVSIEESTSSIARDLRDFIAGEVSAGKSDEEIYDYFVDRYTEAVLLSPAWAGWGLVLWLLPVAGICIGLVVVLSRRRRGAVPSGDLLDQLAHVRLDLDEIEIQEDAGEIAPEEADRLRRSYLDERDVVSAALTGPTRRGRRIDRRSIIGAGVLVVGAVAVTVVLVNGARDPLGPAVGGVFDAAADPVDLASVTNEEMEQVVAENPEVVGMRLALARRYFEDGDFTKALPHFLGVLDREPNAEALASIGWMTYVSDEASVAEEYVVRSIEVDPDYPQAYWYLGNIRLLGLDEPAEAIEPFEKLLAYGDLPADIRSSAERLLEQARAAA